MKIDRLIEELKKIQKKHGNDVVVNSTDFDLGGGIDCMLGDVRVAFFEDDEDAHDMTITARNENPAS